MSISTNPDVITDGLVICIDPSNPRSFTSPTTLTDISKQKIGNFTINGSPNVLTTGSVSTIDINYDQTTKYIQRYPCEFPTEDITVTIGATRNSNSTSYPLSYADSIGGQNSFLIISSTGNLQILVANSSALFNMLGPSTGDYNIITVSRNTSTTVQKAFLNNLKQSVSAPTVQNAVIGSGGSFIIGQEQDSIGGGFVGSQVLNGLFYFCFVYDRVLSDEEILQNYYALRGRGFG